VAEIGGIERTISLALTPEAKVGDYVLLHTGFAINVLDPQEAEETLRLFSELAEFYIEETQARPSDEPSSSPALDEIR
jgi:hydrogenase expression/formation protein HypC